MIHPASAQEPDLTAADDDAIRHPLLSDEAQARIEEHPDLSAEELWQHLWPYDQILEHRGGVVEERSGATWQEAHVRNDSTIEPPAQRTSGVIDTWLADPTSAPATVDVALRLDRRTWDEMVTVPYQQELALLRGEATTEGDWKSVRVASVEARRWAGEQAMSPVLDAIEAAGGEVLSASGFSGTVSARIPATALRTIADRSDVVSLTAEGREEVLESPGHATTIDGIPVDGVERADWVQTNPLYNAGYHGNPLEMVVVTEGGGEGGADTIHNEHVSFETSIGGLRMLNCQGTSHTTCTYANVSSGVGHGTGGASILGSDITDGQDLSITDPTEQEKRSGIMRDGFILGIDGDPRARMVDLVSANAAVHILNKSSGVFGSDNLCAGAEPADADFNSLFEAGVALVKSAGNENTAPDPSNDCNVSTPGNAIGVFTVSAIHLTPGGGLLLGNPSVETFFQNSSRGGTATEGYGRTIIDLAAISGHELIAEEDASTNPQYRSNSSTGFHMTSGAAPVVSGAAALFRDWYKTQRGSLIDDPGILYVNLLLMGDGAVEIAEGTLSNTQVETYDLDGFHNRLGAGRLRLRAYGNGGIDNPGGYRTGVGCLGEGESHTIDLNNGNAFPAGVDYIKAVTWWYDKDHDVVAGGGHDEYRLDLERYTNSTGTWDPVVTDDSGDNKQRVFLAGTQLPNGGSKFRLKISGIDVTTDTAACGDDRNRVYYAVIFEDNARDDGNDIDTYVRPHPAVP